MMSTSQRTDMSSGEDAVRRAQIKAYVDWLNAQLKKRPGTRPVEDLKCDLQDGVALINLVAVIAGNDLDNVYYAPSNSAEKEQNINQVIAFMTERRIKMHHTTSKDIVDGNVKAIMRLILALAAHYKPNSVKQSSRSGSRATTPLAGMAQSAAVMLAEARRDASKAGHKPKRPSHFDRLDRQETPGYFHEVRHSTVDGASSSGESPSVHSDHASPHREVNGASGSPSSIGRRLEFGALPKSRSQDLGPGHERMSVESILEDNERKGAVVERLHQEHCRLEEDLQETKHSLFVLQELLLSEEAPGNTEAGADNAEAGCQLESSHPSGQVIILQNKLQQAEEISKQLSVELSRTKKEMLQLQGVNAGLQQRLSEQENSFLVLKAELLRAGFCQQSLENTKNELEQRIKEKDELLLEMKRELLQREHVSDELNVDRQIHQGALEDASRNFKSQIINLHDKIQKVGDTETNLSERMISQDQRMAELEDRILRRPNRHDSPTGHMASMKSFDSDNEDFQLVRESLRCLRNRFHSDDPQHRTIDALEQSISVLMDRLNVTEEHRWMDPAGCSRTDDRSSRLSGSRADNSITSNHGSTKVLYFTERTVTPFMYTIPKRLGEIVLKDIKGIQDRPGNFRYHFKAMDPEFGTVKEEITQDGAVIPGWEGKIVAWIEEDHD